MTAPVTQFDASDPAVDLVKSIGVEELAQAMTDELVALAPYAELAKTPLWLEIRDHVEDHSAATLASLKAGEPPRGDALDFVREVAVRRARQGVPLAQLLNGYRAGYNAVWKMVRDRAAKHGCAADVVVRLGATAVDYFNAISAGMSEAYTAESQRLRAAISDQRREALEHMLAGETPGNDVRLSDFGLQEASVLYVMVARPLELDADLDPIAQSFTAALRTELGRDVLCGVARRRIVAVVGGADGVSAELEQRLEAAWVATGGTCLAGVSTPRSGITDTPAAFAEAERALRQASDDRRFVALSRARLFDDLLSRADQTTMRLLPAWARELVDEDARSKGELCDTLATYLVEQLSVARSAKRLGVHPNTVRYRLGRIESLTGRSTRVFADLVEIVIAQRLLLRS